MVRDIMKDETFLAQKAAPATPDDLPVARDWLDTLAANVRWDREGKFDALLDEFLSHVTDGKPITARQCVAALQKIEE